MAHAHGETGEHFAITDPATGEPVGEAAGAGPQTLEVAISAARDAAAAWAERPVAERALLLNQVADLYEENAAELFALCTREAGKTLADAVSEVREAVDFLRYYAQQAEASEPRWPLGVFACISPWNFPLSIFTGQVAAALVTGNTVLAKPAEETPLIAARAVELMYKAGIPTDVVQLVPGSGEVVGSALTGDPRIDGVCFTGSLPTAKAIDAKMADHLAPGAQLIAETGGLNAMIVDSTALPEQAVRDILASAFQSAGQRCSALRMLYLQEDTAERTLAMLYGAMDQLELGNPWDFSVDVGPVIDHKAKAKMEAYIAGFAERGAVLHQLETPERGIFVPPTVLKVHGIADLKEEIFGPVLHVATFKAEELDSVITAINASGYGLTFALHTRIDGRVEDIAARIRAGNIYVNRNQIGAVVGSQPFGGEGLSGTGPKAGGPNYLGRFWRPAERFTPSNGVNPLSGISIGFAIAAVDQVRIAVETRRHHPRRGADAGPDRRVQRAPHLAARRGALPRAGRRERRAAGQPRARPGQRRPRHRPRRAEDRRAPGRQRRADRRRRQEAGPGGDRGGPADRGRHAFRRRGKRQALAPGPRPPRRRHRPPDHPPLRRRAPDHRTPRLHRHHRQRRQRRTAGGAVRAEYRPSAPSPLRGEGSEARSASDVAKLG